MSRVDKAIEEARKALLVAQGKVEEAAEVCQGSPLADHLNSYCDELINLIYDLRQKHEEHKRRIREAS